MLQARGAGLSLPQGKLASFGLTERGSLTQEKCTVKNKVITLCGEAEGHGLQQGGGLSLKDDPSHEGGFRLIVECKSGNRSFLERSEVVFT